MIILPDKGKKTSQTSKTLKYNALPFVMQDRLGFDIHVREYQDIDHTCIIAMYDDFEPKGMAMGLPPPDEETRRKWVDDIVKTFFSVVALHKKKIIGHAAIDIFRAKDSPEYLIFLHQDFRSRGIGTKLTFTVKKICTQLGCAQTWLTVSSHNTRAINVFKRVGFKFRGAIESEREMVLDLRPKRKRTRNIQPLSQSE